MLSSSRFALRVAPSVSSKTCLLARRLCKAKSKWVWVWVWVGVAITIASMVLLLRILSKDWVRRILGCVRSRKVLVSSEPG